MIKIKIREYKKQDLDSIAKIHIDTWNSTYSSIIPKKYLKNRTYEWQKKKWIDRLFNNFNTKEFMFVAEDDFNRVVGFSTGILNNDENYKFDGRLNTLYVLKDYQRKGYGRLLMKAVALKLEKLGAKTMVLATFAKNHEACNFYEHLGGCKIKVESINVFGTNINEISYEWYNISTLTNLQKI